MRWMEMGRPCCIMQQRVATYTSWPGCYRTGPVTPPAKHLPAATSCTMLPEVRSCTPLLALPASLPTCLPSNPFPLSTACLNMNESWAESP